MKNYVKYAIIYITEGFSKGGIKMKKIEAKKLRRLIKLFPMHIAKLNSSNVHWFTFEEIKSEVAKARERGESRVKLKGCLTKATELKCRLLIKGLLLTKIDYYVYAPILSDIDAWLKIDF